MIDFNKLQKEVTDCINKETSESLREWLNNKRKENMKTKLCKPVLVETKDKSNIHWDEDSHLFYTKSKQFIGINYQLILISLEDEKIEVGELVYKADAKPKIYRYVPTTNPWYKDEVKVIASQSQLSPEYILQFVGEYNRGEVKDVEIEMVDNGYEVDMEGIGGCEIGWMPKFEPKLTNGFITIIEREPILYNEEEVLNMITGYYKYYISAYSPIDTCAMWFEQNKKK